MRWKERFLVPDHRVGNISGASFAGFYYMCLALCEEGMSSEQENFPVPASTLSDESDMSENDLWSFQFELYCWSKQLDKKIYIFFQKNQF